MKIGIIADIHENIERLQLALENLRDLNADRIVLLGDVAETGARLAETVELLIDVGAVGVFGNHDLGLCHEPDEVLVAKQPSHVVEYMASLRARYELDKCLFTHGAPWWDPTDPAVYYLGDRPHDPNMLTRTFEAFPHYVFLMGHFHRWQASNENGNLAWNGTEPLQLERDRRYLVTVHAVHDGYCALLDLEARELHPIRLV